MASDHDNLTLALAAYREADRLVRDGSKLPFISFETWTGPSLNPLQSMVLHQIGGGWATPTELATQFSTATPTMSHVLAELLERGFVTQERHATDGRVRRYSVTTAGQSILDAAASSAASAKRTPQGNWIAAIGKARAALLKMVR